VYLDLSDSTALEDQIRREWVRLGDVLGGVPKLWEGGGFLFLLDGSRGVHDPAAVDRFIRDERSRNTVIFCSPTPPEVDAACHLRIISPA
jgi:hypothetical protein